MGSNESVTVECSGLWDNWIKTDETIEDLFARVDDVITTQEYLRYKTGQCPLGGR